MKKFQSTEYHEYMITKQTLDNEAIDALLIEEGLPSISEDDLNNS